MLPTYQNFQFSPSNPCWVDLCCIESLLEIETASDSFLNTVTLSEIALTKPYKNMRFKEVSGMIPDQLEIRPAGPADTAT